MEEKEIAHHPEGLIFTDRKGDITILPDAKQRKRESEEEKAEVRPEDFRTLSYKHYESKKEAEADRWRTAELARAKLAEFRNGDPRSIATGTEIEGTLYDKNGNLLTVHKGNVTFDDAPPELFDAQLEIVTGKTKDGHYPSSALEISKTLRDAVNVGEKIADERNGLLVFSSVPEGGSPEQLRLTQHPKVLSSYERGQTGVTPEAPHEVEDICKTVGVTDIVPYQGTHSHTSNPELPEGEFDAKAAYAAGIIELTQISQVESFMLANTRDYLGTHLDNMRDVRSILKRAQLGAQDTKIPDNAYDLVNDSMNALKEGDTHEMSRHPVTGQHDRVRIIKEFGTTESVAGAANPDLRLIMAHTYFKQLMRVLSYQALDATNGDESKVLSYLQNEYKGGKYDYLFEKLQTKEGKNSSFEQDKRFNMDGFDAGTGEKSYSEQVADIREIVRDLGSEFSAFRTQAKIVDHVLEKIVEPPKRGIGLRQYMDTQSGMKGGIITDYKFGDNIPENIRAQAEGTKKQVKTLEKIKDDDDLLKFFGIKKDKTDSSSHRPTRHAPRQ